jgi:hypothetical protein
MSCQLIDKGLIERTRYPKEVKLPSNDAPPLQSEHRMGF